MGEMGWSDLDHVGGWVVGGIKAWFLVICPTKAGPSAPLKNASLRMTGDFSKGALEAAP
jgi:hypothetical protein